MSKTAQKQIAKDLEEIKEMMESLQEHINKDCGIDRSQANWAHAGDVASIKVLLQETMERAGLR